MELTKARAIAEELKGLLEPSCQGIEIAGSIRRQKPEPHDIELLVIPKVYSGVDLLDKFIMDLMFQGELAYRLNKKGSKVYGPKNKLLLHVPSGIGVDVFSTTEKCWYMSLVIRTGGEKTNKHLAMAAIRKGWKLRAYGDGYDTPSGHTHCDSERDVFEFVDLCYLEPWERD